MDSDAALEAFGYHSTLSGTTTISTIVLHSDPVKLVVALLQSGDQFHIKVVEAEPRLTFLGGDLDEAVLLQRQHDEVLRKLQEACRDTMIPIEVDPVEEFLAKIKDLRTDVLASVMSALREGNELLAHLKEIAKEGSLDSRPDHIKQDAVKAILQVEVWLEDLHDRRNALEIAWQSRKSQLEQCLQLAVLVKELEDIEAMLHRRESDMSIAFTLGDTESIVDHLLREYVGLKDDAMLLRDRALRAAKATEDLVRSDCFAGDEACARAYAIAWQSRKSQLEQCLQLAVLVKELEDIEAMLHRRESDMSIAFTLGDTESIVDHLLREYVGLKDDAMLLRDRALRAAKATEDLVRSDCFAGDEACARAYAVLARCTDFFDETDRRENWLLQAKDFFHRAEAALATLDAMEAEVTRAKMGYCLMDDVGRTQPEVMGVKRVVEEMENRKIYLEQVCSMNSEKHVTISEHINTFFLHYNEILSWLVSTAEATLKNHNTFGRNLPTAHEFLTAHHKLLSDLEEKGREINKLLTSLAPILEEVDVDQRRSIDEKVGALRKHWTDVKNITDARVDLVLLYIQFLDESESLAKTFDQIEAILKTSPSEENLQRIQKAWTVIQPAYTEIKLTARRFIDEASKVADPYLETKSACSRVDEILNDFSSRQFSITESWESWTHSVTIKRETELLWEKIMSENVQTLNAASKLDAQLYPVLSSASNDPGDLKGFIADRLTAVLGDIAKAKCDLQERITATSSLDAKDGGTTEKLQQVIENLTSIKGKLDRIANEYETLVISIVSFLDAIVTTKRRIEDYFATQKVINRDSAERVVSDHEAFRDSIKAQFRSLISQSETIIERVRTQEPPGAREHDTDRIITLLEHLRGTFESQIETKSNELREQQQLGLFNRELKDIHGNLDDMTKQLEETEGQTCENLAAISTKSIAFEYFERTIDLLGKRIENFRRSAENISTTYPNTRAYVEEEVRKLLQRWEEFCERSRKSRRSLDLSVEYFKLLDEINTQYRIHSTYYAHTSNTVPFVSSIEQANDLVNQIDDYIDQNEASQLNKLKKLSEISIEIYGLDKTVTIYTENLSLFQSFLKLKADLNATVEKLKEEQIRERSEKVEKLKIIEVQTTQSIAPIFTQTLTDATIQEGERFTFDCAVTGSPEPAIEWLKDGISIQSNSDYKTTTIDGLCSLSIEETLAEDSATFTCRATNAAGSAETTARLTVKENFSITESWESWTHSVTIKRETELLWEKIMSENVQTLNAASKLDAQLYPVLSSASNDPGDLKGFIADRLTAVLGDIAKAKCDLQERITATSSLDAKDGGTTEKLQQMPLVTTKRRIEDYFATQKVINRDSAERVVSDHEAFRDSIKAQFRSLISQSETIIERVRTQEPPGAREHDTDRIITLLEHLRGTFESQIETKSNELREQQQLGLFNRELKDIHGNLDDMTKQLEETEGQTCENLAAISTKSIAFEYFERTIDVSINYRTRKFIGQRTIMARGWLPRHCRKIYQRHIPIRGRMWRKRCESCCNDGKNSVRDHEKSRRSLDLSVEYFKLLDEINTQYRIHSTYYAHTSNTVPFVSSIEQANDLIYGLDKTVTIYTENLSLFQSFLKLKADLNATVEKLKEEQIRERSEKVEKLKIIEVQTTQSIAPIFTQTLTDATIQEGERFTFDCAVTGSPEPAIEWLKDGISIQSNSDYKTTTIDGLCSLSIEETLAEDSATFTCRATNAAGSAETTARLTVKENVAEEPLVPPSFVELLQPGYAKEGATFEFRCRAAGYPLPVVEWFKNDVCIDQSPDYIITFNNGLAILKFEHVFLEDQATFTCRATNTSGMVETSANLCVEPLEPTEVPAFKVSLSNVMARVGQKIKLECEVTGIPRPELFWTHNGKPFTGRDSKLIVDGDRVTLLIPEAFFKDTGVYTLTAKNLAGEVSNSCNVCVKGRVPNETSDSEFASDMEPVKPAVQLPLKNTSVFEGKSVRLDCVIVGQPEPEVIWYHDDRPVKESADIQLLFQGDRCSLLIHEAYTEDAGEYKVIAINSAGETSSICQLTVSPLNNLEPATRMTGERMQSTVSPPKFEKLLIDILASEGEKVVFECLVSGDPRPEIKWLLNNREIIPNERIQTSYADDGTIKLTIENVTSNDKGLYTVKATNSSGESKCFSHLIVKSVNAGDTQTASQDVIIEEHYICPMFKELFSDRVVRIDEPTKFECIVFGKPTPKVRWLFNDEPVHGKNFLISTSGDRQVLAIPAVTSETTGKIACVAENEIGKATCVAYLNLQGDYIPTQVASPQTYTQEHNTQSSLVTIKKQMFTTTSTQQVSSVANNIPQTQILTRPSNSPILWSSDKYQEYHQDHAPSHQQKSIVIRTVADVPKATRKHTPPRFISPLIGKIVDQGANVVLEAVVDGHPSPDVKVTKNGEPIENDAHINVTYNYNKVTIQLNNVSVSDAGRYICTANNAAGTSTSVADLTQIAKLGERVIMDVEITGLPEPTVTWYKDDLPLNEASLSQHKVQKMGNCYKLIIEKASLTDAGKYMVSAVNPGGKAESIASFAVMEKTPERVVEVIKTVVYEDPQDHTRKGSEESSAILRPPSSSHSAHTVSQATMDLHGSEESTIVTETRRTTEATMRMEHKVSFPDLPPLTQTQNTQTHATPMRHEATMSDSAALKSSGTNTEALEMKRVATQTPPQVPTKPCQEEEEVIQTQSITKKSAMEYFEHKIKSEPEEKYTKFSDLKVSPFEQKLSSDLKMLNLEPGPAPEIGFMPKGDQVKRENISDRIKRLEEGHRETETPSGGIRVFPQLSRADEPGSVSPRPSAEAVAMEKLWASPKPHEVHDFTEKKTTEQRYTWASSQEMSIGTCHDVPTEVPTTDDTLKNYSITSAKKVFEDKLKEAPELVAPQLVRQVSKERPKSVHELFHAIHLEPGSPPEVCYAPKPTFERKKSLVETLEESLERKIESEPTRVPPGGVRIVPPPKREKSLPPTIQPPPVVPCLRSDVSEAELSSDFESLPRLAQFRHVEAPKVTREPHKAPSDAPPSSVFPSGYMADTEDQSTIPHHHDTQFAPNAKHYRHHNHKHERIYESSGTDPKEYSTASLIKNISVTTTQYKYLDDHQLEPLPYTVDPPQAKRPRIPPPPSPSKFIKGEFRESDYESDYEGRIVPIWRPTDSDSEPQYRPVRPVLTPTGRRSGVSDGHRSPTPPSEFDRKPRPSDGPPRPKFEPIEKINRITETSYSHSTRQQQQQHHQQPFVHKPTPVTSTRYFTATAGTPVHNTIATETSNTMHMREHTETSHRVVNMNQTTRVIKFDGGQKKSELEPFPYAPPTNGDTSPRPRVSLPPTPTRFVKGDFRESDYESEVDAARIRPVWTPNPLDGDEPHYRRVAPPQPTRSASCPRSYPAERVLTPMEFDRQGPLMPQLSPSLTPTKDYRTQTLDRYATKRVHQYVTTKMTQDDTSIRHQQPIQAYAQHQMRDLGSSIKTKATQFMRDVASDLKQPQKPILKKATSTENEPQAYREESRISQYGTKHIDPDTGLIYFKYDFGYEFGILFPGEGKKFIGGSSAGRPHRQVQAQQRSGDIELPVLHERTHKPATNGTTSDQWGPNKRYSLPISINIDELHQQNIDGRGDQRSVGQRIQTPVNFSKEDKPKKPPAIITPLKDIAVVAGQTARFECIVQSDPHPEVIWCRNGVMIGRSLKHHIEYRNGVCRLTIPHAFTEDAGTYSCTASNQLGSVTTSADLLVPGNKWGPSKDIAVVAGQTARFECIVQSDPHPEVIWCRNGVMIGRSLKHHIEYRNGVCRLTIPHAFTEDAGTYSCTASNQLGS
uniref:Ig-like domain-containing protein n=2 Tax=Lutzomyia longipalpis TaxID=7200 RepID=A0A1B0CIV6_LUTLO